MTDDDRQYVAGVLAEVVRQTAEMDDCQERLVRVSEERRDLIAELRSRQVTYRRIAEATGLHQATVKTHMARWRADSMNATTDEPCNITLTNLEPVAGARSV